MVCNCGLPKSYSLVLMYFRLNSPVDKEALHSVIRTAQRTFVISSCVQQKVNI